MKFVTFEVKTVLGPVQRIGVLRGQEIIDLNAAYGAYLRNVRDIYRWREVAETLVPPDMLKFIEGGEISREAMQIGLDYFAKEGNQPAYQNGNKILYSLSEVRLMAPVPRPVSIRDCSTFLQHITDAWKKRGKDLPQMYKEIPVHYRTSHTDVVGTDAPILWPSYTEKLDYELELMVCIGKRGINIPVEKAEDYIFGYTIFNDVSARDIGKKELAMELGPAKAKCFQNSNIMGPCLVTPDEIDAKNLKMIARINGEVWSEGNSRDMYFKFPQLIAYISKDDYLYPGEFIGSGTVGNGCGSELNRWVQPGDVIEFEAEGIGILKNKITR